MPAWFMGLLASEGEGYHTLAEAARELPDPAAYAEVERYRRHHERCAALDAERRLLNAEIDSTDTHLTQIQHRMEAAGLHEQLAGLEGRMDIALEGRPRQQRRPHSRRTRPGRFVHGHPEQSL